MSLTFITGNENKFRELQDVLPDLQQLSLELEELQTLDPKVIISHKLQQALTLHPGPIIVEDTSLVVTAWNGLPGPLIKWFLKSMGLEQLAQLATHNGTQPAAAVATTLIGWATNPTEVKFFSGSTQGQVVLPRGDSGFGWDSIFQPDGTSQTFGEMSLDQKQHWSMRRKAAEQLQLQLQ